MEIAPVSTSPAMASAVRQLDTQSELQTAVMKQLSDSQAQLADMLYVQGVGGNVDLQA